jgi:hypothetical protein
MYIEIVLRITAITDGDVETFGFCFMKPDLNAGQTAQDDPESEKFTLNPERT